MSLSHTYCFSQVMVVVRQTPRPRRRDRPQSLARAPTTLRLSTLLTSTAPQAYSERLTSLPDTRSSRAKGGPQSSHSRSHLAQARARHARDLTATTTTTPTSHLSAKIITATGALALNTHQSSSPANSHHQRPVGHVLCEARQPHLPRNLLRTNHKAFTSRAPSQQLSSPRL